MEKCDGCVLLRKNRDCFYNKADGCPCKICLVKVMCNKSCGDLKIHFRIVKEHTGKKSHIDIQTGNIVVY